ncbi:MAG: PAS domain-containing protein [Verrucomicrobiaceae bacterium]|nr:PAS domain-containing protein [Verrucomicrobiaceae bacterium]
MLLTLALLTIGLVSVTGEAMFLARYNTKQATKFTQDRARRLGSWVARMAVRYLPNNQRSPFRSELKRIQQEDGVTFVALCNADGTINLARSSRYTRLHVTEALIPEAATLVMENMQILSPVFKPTTDQSRLMAVIPLRLPDGTVMSVYHEMDLTEPLARAKKAAVVEGLVSGGVLVVFCLGLWFILNRTVTSRVHHIVTSAQAMAEGKPVPDPLRGSDELAMIDSAMRIAHATVNGQAEEVRAQRERFRTMVESLPVGVITMRAGVVTFVNKAAQDLLGNRSQSSESLPQELQHAIEQLTQSDGPQLIELTIPAPDERGLLQLEVTAHSQVGPRGQGTQVMLHDVTARRAAERQREALSHEIANASEREQRRIGQDLHDDICQRLAAIKITMQDFEEILAAQAPGLMDDADHIVDQITDAIHITRALARGLSPVDIDAGGLGVALAALARSAREVHGVECRLNIPESLPDISQHTATQLYRIAQESINNAAKHAHASNITVDLTSHSDDHLELSVANDGQPFTPSATSGGGMGLPIMRYRAASIGGSITFETGSLSTATTMRCSVPLSNPSLS